MLHDPSSYSPPLEITEINLRQEEKEVLRRFAEEIAEIAADPVNNERALLWTKLNDLESERPMVWINEIPWHEMNVNDELTLQCKNEWARELENKLRREIYQRRHMKGDMVINDYLECPLAIHSTDFGIIEDVDLAITDETSDIVSRHFNIQIQEPEDIEKIQMPVVTHSEETTQVVYETRVGSGGYGYTSELPGEPYHPEYVKPHNMWGCSNAQIFSEVSPEMHWEFALEHDFHWLKRWGLTYYGCCEPLHKKMHLLRKIPNLRKVSSSPWIDVKSMTKELGTDYVMSFKPNPAVFTSACLDEDAVRRELEEVIAAGGGRTHIEFIMKDISTVKYKPENLWRWAEIATEIAEGNPAK